MLLINIMVAFASLLFYAVLSEYGTLGTLGAFLTTLFIFILANGPQFIKVEIYKHKSASLISKIWGTALVLFILGLSYKPFITLWNQSVANDDMMLKLFLAWAVLVAGFLVGIPLIKVTKIDREIANKIKDAVS